MKINRINFKVTYKGKTYHRVVDFAKDCGISSRLVLERYKRGWRNPHRLAKPPIKKFYHPGPYKVTYKGIEYYGVTKFCKAFNLSYPKVNRLWANGIRNPEELITKGVRLDDKLALKEQREKDFTNKIKILKEYNLFTFKEVANLTNSSLESIISATYDLTRTDKRASKSGISTIGIQKNDIVDFSKIKDSDDQQLLKISNIRAVPKIVLKESAIKHIKEKQQLIKSLELKPFPFFDENYFYDHKSQTMWHKVKGKYRQVKNHNQKFTLRHKKIRYVFSISNVEDIYQNPKVKFEDLYTLEELCVILIISKNYWKNHGFSRNLPPMHTRYNFKTKNHKSGWTKQELIRAFSKNEETKKYLDRIKNLQ